jgi:hypothetical protein
MFVNTNTNRFVSPIRYTKLAWETTPYKLNGTNIRLPKGAYDIISSGGQILFELTKNTKWRLDEEDGHPSMSFHAIYPDVGVTLKTRRNWRGAPDNQVEGAQAVLQGLRERVMNSIHLAIEQEAKYVEKYIAFQMAGNHDEETAEDKEKRLNYYLKHVREVQTQMRFLIYMLNDDKANCDKWFNKVKDGVTENLVMLQENPEKYSVTALKEDGSEVGFDMKKEQSYIDIANRMKGMFEHGKYMRRIHFARPNEIINIFVAGFEDGEKAIIENPYTKTPHIFFKFEGAAGMILAINKQTEIPMTIEEADEQSDKFIFTAIGLEMMGKIPVSQHI